MVLSDNLKNVKSAERYQDSEADELDEPIVHGAIDDMKKFSMQGFVSIAP